MAEGLRDIARKIFLGRKTPLEEITPAKLADGIVQNQHPTRLGGWKPVSVEAVMRNLNLTGLRTGEKLNPKTVAKVNERLGELVRQGALERTEDGNFRVKDANKLRALAEQERR